MQNEWVLFLARDADKAYQAAKAVVSRHNITHPSDQITVTGTLFDLYCYYKEADDHWLEKVYKTAMDLSIYDKMPRQRELAKLDQEIATSEPSLGLGL